MLDSILNTVMKMYEIFCIRTNGFNLIIIDYNYNIK